MTAEMFAVLWIYFVPIVGGLVAVWVRFCIDQADLDAAVDAKVARSVSGIREREAIRETRHWRAGQIAAARARRVEEAMTDYLCDATVQLRTYGGHPTGYHPDLAAEGWSS